MMFLLQNREIINKANNFVNQKPKTPEKQVTKDTSQKKKLDKILDSLISLEKRVDKRLEKIKAKQSKLQIYSISNLFTLIISFR